MNMWGNCTGKNRKVWSKRQLWYVRKSYWKSCKNKRCPV